MRIARILLRCSIATISLLSTLSSHTEANDIRASTIPILSTDRVSEIIHKAAHVVPTPRQMSYHRREFIAFVHFGPNTFTGREWGTGKESAALFHPERLDTDQWCRALKEAEMTMVVLTVKHHDGYCLWQTRYEDQHSVRNSPWRKGKGDVLRDLARSCKKTGLKLGVYLSPADLFQIESPTGLYGNGSPSRLSTIPTNPSTFSTEPSRGQRVAESQPTFTVEVDDYNRYFLNQLYELLTEYGPVHEVWFDGAHPKRKGNQQYAYQHWYHLIRTLAPQAVIFGKGPDVRWCGNEAGNTRQSEWNVIPLEVPPNKSDWPDLSANDLGSRQQLAKAKFLYYLPAETNTSIRHGWFWRNDHEQQVRSADDVFDIYERAVGGNSVFMLNVPPNREGRFSERDVACLKEVGSRIRNTYGVPVGEWARQDSQMEGHWNGVLARPEKFNRLVIQEDIANVGQRVESHVIEAEIDGEFREISHGTTIGYKKIHRFPTVTTKAIRVRIDQSRLAPKLLPPTAHYYAEVAPHVNIRRDGDGSVILSLKKPKRFTWKRGKSVNRSEENSFQIHYSSDGTIPTLESPRYDAPIPFADGGIIRARSFGGELKGPVSSKTLGIMPTSWRVWASSEQSSHQATNAIDGNPNTYWQSRQDSEKPSSLPSLAIELDKERTLAGFLFLPCQDRRSSNSSVEHWRVEMSIDGEVWIPIAAGQFNNLLNDPSQRRHDFTKHVSARYFRFVSRSEEQNLPQVGVAELDLLAPSH